MATVSTERVITDGIDALTPEQAIRYLDLHNQGKLTTAEKEEIVSTIWSVGTKLGIRPGRVFAQMCHETADFTFPNQVRIARHNPAGIGATNNGAAGVQYPSWSAGIMGYYVHLAAWLGGPAVVGGIAPYYNTQVDPRVHIVEQVRAVKGPVVTWADLGGRWAVPGVGYGDAIDRKYAAILATAAETRTTMQLYAETLSELTPGSNRPGGRLLSFDAFVVHETDNENVGAGAINTYNYLMGTYNNGNRPLASFHFCTDGIAGGHSLQFLPSGPRDAEPCWAIGDGQNEADDASNHTVSGEICVNKDGNYNIAVGKMVTIVANVLRAHGKQPIKDVTIRQHGSYWSVRNPAVHQGCPKHLKAGDWGNPRITWDGFCNMVKAEYDKGTAGKVPIPPKVGTDPISQALTSWYMSNTPAVQGDLSPNSYRECDVYFGGLYPTLQGWQRAIRGEFVMAWYHPDGAISCVHPADKIAIETNPEWFRLR